MGIVHDSISIKITNHFINVTAKMSYLSNRSAVTRRMCVDSCYDLTDDCKSNDSKNIIRLSKIVEVLTPFHFSSRTMYSQYPLAFELA